MIGERYAIGGRSGTLRVGSGSTPARLTWAQRRTRAGRLLIAQWVGNSALAQVLAATTFIALALLFYLLQAGQASVLTVNLAVLQAEHTQLVARNATLQASATGLQSLQRIDSTASNEMHMTKPDISQTIWLNPVVPRATTPPPTVPLLTAQQQSEPLAWAQRFARFIKSSL